MKCRIIIIFIIINILICSSLMSVVSQNFQEEYYNKNSGPLGLIPKIYPRVLVKGNASSGKQFGIFGKIGIIKFNHAQFVIIRFFPIKLVINNVKNATAIMFGIDQNLSSGSFDFKEEWIFLAIVFE